MTNYQFLEIKNNNINNQKVKISIKTAEELAHMDFPDREWLIKDLWREREHMMIYSPTGMGKSWFAWSIATAITGDGAKRDEEGYYWITGRVDDVLNVSGHRMGTAEIESALVSHPKVAEAAVVGYPHEVKGEGIYAYVTLNSDVNVSKDLHIELINWVKKEIGPIAKPDYLQWAPSLPKTRSGKIMRRILRKIASNDYNDLGDTSTLAEPGVVKELVEKRLNR